MSGQIQLQSDLGALGITGLGAFSTILATLSADNVTPMAMVQMQNLGGAFHISGAFAAKVPDLLMRFNAHPLGRLAVAVGWRKGDSASLLAETAGGQAVALLSVVLLNLFTTENCGEVLSNLSSRLLPAQLVVASVSQLTDVAAILANKLFALGFGNFLAEQVVRIHDAYHSLGIETPRDLLESMTVDAAVDLLHSLNQAICEEATVLRLSGASGMGHIIGLVLFAFPHDTVVTVENVIIHEGPRPSILVELNSGSSGPVTATVEKIIASAGPIPIPITVKPREYTDFAAMYVFTWHGWLAKRLQLAFMDIGVTCTQQILSAFSNLLVAVTTECMGDSWYTKANPLPGGRISALLGFHPQLRMEEVCEAVLLTTPTSYELDLQTAFFNFAQTVQETVAFAKACSCEKNKCDFADGWLDAREKSKKRCKAHILWKLTGILLSSGMLCFFINARPNATINGDFVNDIVPQIIRKKFVSCQDLYNNILWTVASGIDDHYATINLLACSFASTIYPTVLETLQIPSRQFVSFELVDGVLMFCDRYFVTLQGENAPVRPKAKKSITRPRSQVIPSSLGEHSDLLITIREIARYLELRATAHYSGVNLHLDLAQIIPAYLGLERTESCSHPSTDPLVDNSQEIITTSVASPRTFPGRAIAIAMTQSNPTAQLLCCEPGARAILMQDCCLDCALDQAVNGSFEMIIVS